ncbi:hypothetical protein D9M69_585530 [compost metagenome]
MALVEALRLAVLRASAARWASCAAASERMAVTCASVRSVCSAMKRLAASNADLSCMPASCFCSWAMYLSPASTASCCAWLLASCAAVFCSVSPVRALSTCRLACSVSTSSTTAPWPRSMALAISSVTPGTPRMLSATVFQLTSMPAAASADAWRTRSRAISVSSARRSPRMP